MRSPYQTLALAALWLVACEGTTLPGGLTSMGSTSSAVATDGVFDPTTGGLPIPTDPDGDTSLGMVSSSGASGTTEGGADRGEATDSDDATSGSGTTTDATAEGSSSGEPVDDCDPILAEVYYDLAAGDDMLEWVRLYNPCAGPRDLSDYSLGWGGSDYTYGTVDLSGTIEATGCFAVGGPMSTDANASPMLDLPLDLEPDLQNSGATADGLALFRLPAAAIGGAVPVDAVVYGDSNDSGLIGASGVASAPQVGDAPPGSVLRRTAIASSWVIDLPNPAACPPF